MLVMSKQIKLLGILLFITYSAGLAFPALSQEAEKKYIEEKLQSTVIKNIQEKVGDIKDNISSPGIDYEALPRKGSMMFNEEDLKKLYAAIKGNFDSEAVANTAMKVEV